MAEVKFAIPKGSLEKATFRILEEAWYSIYGKERTYRPKIDDPTIDLKMIRPQEIPVVVAEGIYDVGITGQDWIRETAADVETLLNLEYGKIRLVVAVPETLTAESFGDFLRTYRERNSPIRISSEYLNISEAYIRNHVVYKEFFGEKAPTVVTPWLRKGENPNVTLFLSFGATEAKPPEDADAVIDLTETGTTLAGNKLKEVDTVYESSSVLVANKSSLKDPKKREKIYDIVTLLKGVVDAKKNIHIFVNVRKDNLDRLLSQLPALKGPTVSPLADKEWYSVNTVVRKDVFLKLLPTLRRLAQGLVVHEPKQLLPLEEIARDENNEPE